MDLAYCWQRLYDKQSSTRNLVKTIDENLMQTKKK